MLGLSEQRVGDVRVQVFLLLARRVQNRCQRNLRRCVNQTRVGEERLIEEVVDALAEPVGILHLTARFDVDEEAFDGSERVVHGEVVVELLHEQKFVAENYVHRLVPVAFDVRHELLDGHVELLDFAREVNASGTEMMAMKPLQ